MNRKHILIVSQYFYPESFRVNDMASEWVKRGHKVTVLTGIPNYPEGKFYSGYSWLKKRKETWEGVEIIRIPLIARGHSSIGLILNYLSFVFFGAFWKTFTRVKADCVFTFEVSPMTQALIGVWYGKRRKIPHYLYVQDLWPENVQIITGIENKLVLGGIGKMVDYIYKHCDRIFATSPSFVKQIQKRVEDKEKVIYWPQYAEDFYKPLEKCCIESIPNDNRLKIIFTGNIGYAQGLDVLPLVANLLKEKKEKDVLFVIVGDGRYKPQFVEDIQKYDVCDLFVMIDRQAAEDIPMYLAACDVAFLSFMNNDLFAQTIPAKLQSYMACGMPIVAAACGETERIIKEAECGLVCNIGDERSLLDAILEMKENADLSLMGLNAQNYFQKHFRKELLMNQMAEYIH